MTTESLYPFLHAGSADRAELLADVARSTREKVAEIERLRAEVLAAEAEALAGCATAMAERFARGGRLYAFGNGGSSTDALAVASLCLDPGSGRRPLPAVALPGDVATLTALANDVGFDVVFARPLAAAGRPEDIAFGLSTSGGSANVLRGLAAAHERGMLTVGLAGYSGGEMAEAAERGELDHLFVMPSASVHRIQEAQTTVYQVLWELVQSRL
ncbi:D-sedoheptulose-7-phosphate isomerase [Pseudonocardia asaccharolytica]|uniref:Phosphoheptose isomerase n=1 Tax=Pseudonocardia asaccharolytica DSM 44247 = NBRC 16224 TaxID=1123024 RepID=A0A511D837_9PSEU|nr:SIS domain-containing protein [Pseudonocardia asaccharolytica]GEL19804.1 phosphoheptose isomerase [Pseudonocardia asaccharolytica DSM 44247 = NBRC 16224]